VLTQAVKVKDADYFAQVGLPYSQDELGQNEVPAQKCFDARNVPEELVRAPLRVPFAEHLYETRYNLYLHRTGIATDLSIVTVDHLCDVSVKMESFE